MPSVSDPLGFRRCLRFHGYFSRFTRDDRRHIVEMDRPDVITTAESTLIAWTVANFKKLRLFTECLPGAEGRCDPMCTVETL